MPGRRGIVLLLILLVFAVILSACGGGKKENESDKAGNGNTEGEVDKWAAEYNPDLSGKIVIWTVGAAFAEPFVEGFNKFYPNVEVEVVDQGIADVVPKTKTAISAGKGGPDIVQYHMNQAPAFNTGVGLVDLFQEPYNAHLLKDGYTEANWHRWLSLDGKSMYALPGPQNPRLTWYREDILEDYGYPTDPDELGEFLQNKENFLNMAQTFKADGKWVTTLKNWEINLYLGDRGFFDEKLEYARNNDDGLIEVMDLAKQLNQLGLHSNYMVVWNADANRELDAGNIVMLMIEMNFNVEEYAPNTVGKWKVTRLPMDWHFAGQGVSMSILEQSKNKEAAWAFIKYMHATREGQLDYFDKLQEIPPLKVIWDEPVFDDFIDESTNGQNTFKIAMEELERIPIVPRKSELDTTAQPIWDRHINAMFENNLDSKATLDAAQAEIEAAVSVDRENLKQLLGL